MNLITNPGGGNPTLLNFNKMERQRKDNIKKGERTQRPFCFRLDNDIRERLNTVPNKGRFINDAIRDKLHTLGIN